MYAIQLFKGTLLTHELGNWHPTQGSLITSSLVCVKGVIACDDMTKKCKNEND